jgi:hypothetical protein
MGTIVPAASYFTLPSDGAAHALQFSLGHVPNKYDARDTFRCLHVFAT